MSVLYINEYGVEVGGKGHRFVVKYQNNLKRIIPEETLESIVVLGSAKLSIQCIERCLKSGIDVSYFSKNGSCFGRIQSTGHTKAERQRQQCKLYDSEFALQLSKNIIFHKLKNQLVILRRYEKNRNMNLLLIPVDNSPLYKERKWVNIQNCF